VKPLDSISSSNLNFGSDFSPTSVSALTRFHFGDCTDPPGSIAPIPLAYASSRMRKHPPSNFGCSPNSTEFFGLFGSHVSSETHGLGIGFFGIHRVFRDSSGVRFRSYTDSASS
jgi:hypothetical protein